MQIRIICVESWKVSQDAQKEYLKRFLLLQTEIIEYLGKTQLLHLPQLKKN